MNPARSLLPQALAALVLFGLGGCASSPRAALDGAWIRSAPADRAGADGLVFAPDGGLQVLGACALRGQAWRLEPDGRLTLWLLAPDHPPAYGQRYRLTRIGRAEIELSAPSDWFTGRYRRADARRVQALTCTATDEAKASARPSE